MLVFASFIPHPLISIPEIGKRSNVKMRATTAALRSIMLELYAAQPAVIVIISPHGDAVPDTFMINQQPRMQVSFKQFGDLVDQYEIANATGFGYRLKESAETKLPLLVTDETILDYGTGVVLYNVFTRIKPEALQLVSITFNSASLENHAAVAAHLNKYISIASQRIAVLVTGDLAHGAGRSGAIPYNPAAKKFNDAMHAVVGSGDREALAHVIATTTPAVPECGSRSLYFLLSLLGDRVYKPDIRSYETVSGVGYMTATFGVR